MKTKDIQIIKTGQFARKCRTKWSKTHIVTVTLKRKEKGS
jgi:hypothetical protein